MNVKNVDLIWSTVNVINGPEVTISVGHGMTAASGARPLSTFQYMSDIFEIMSEETISIDSVLEKPIGHVPHNSYSEEGSR